MKFKIPKPIVYVFILSIFVAWSRWDGKLPETMTGSAMPFLNVGGNTSTK